MIFTEKQISSKEKPSLPWKCAEVCGLSFSDPEQLRRHKKTAPLHHIFEAIVQHDPVTGKDILYCHYCDRIFKNLVSMHIHLLSGVPPEFTGWLLPSTDAQSSDGDDDDDDDDDRDSFYSSNTSFEDHFETFVPPACTGLFNVAEHFASVLKLPPPVDYWCHMAQVESSKTGGEDKLEAELPPFGPPTLQEHLLRTSLKMAAANTRLKVTEERLARVALYHMVKMEAMQSEVEDADEIISSLESKHAEKMAEMRSKLKAALEDVSRHKSQHRREIESMQLKLRSADDTMQRNRVCMFADECKINQLEDELARRDSEFAAKMAAMESELRTAKDAALSQREARRECPMCYERDVDTVSKCGHQFCGSCISHWQTQSNHSRNPWQTPCPVCRKAMGKPIKVFAL